MKKLDDLICPHCLGYTEYDTSADETICAICNNTITQEDLEYVFTNN